MKADDPNLKPQYRMPRVFGNLPGPRNVPKDKQHLPNRQTATLVSITALSTAEALQELLPPNCELDGEPLFTVNCMYLENIGWLAGHGYNIVTTLIRMAHDSKSQGRVVGMFQPVLWENLADPILTGREELGFSKLYAEIPMPRLVGDSAQGLAAWQGFRFFEFEATGLEDASPETPPSDAGSFHYKFIPTTGAQGEADVQYLEYSAPGTSAAGYGARPVRRRVGKGSFKWSHARWEDVPFQYPILNALADIPIVEWRSASVTNMEATGPIGDVSAGNLKEIK